MAKKMVGLGYPLKLEWMNKALNLVCEGMAQDNIKEALDDYLGFEIEGLESRRKTRDILMNIWVKPFEESTSTELRSSVLELVKAGNEDNLVFHWCMLLLTYPVFADLTEMIGKLTTMQDTFSQEWLMGKLYEAWGERTTLYQSVRKSLQTMRQIEVLSSTKGVYTVYHTQVSNPDTKKVLIKTILALKKRAYYEPSELASVPQMFPFEYEVDSELIFGSNDFELGNFGGSPVVVG